MKRNKLIDLMQAKLKPSAHQSLMNRLSQVNQGNLME